MKLYLTSTDINRLDAARGLDLEAPNHNNGCGLKPSVEAYNRAIKVQSYTGIPITPIGTEAGVE